MRADKVVKRGIKATQFQVVIDRETVQPHRHLSHIIEIIQNSALEDAAKASAVSIFERIGRAEASVHGIPVEKVHFHEVGALDSILDIVLACAALHQLGIERVLCSPLITGSGTLTCDHGIMPVPAPATALLLQGVPWSAGDVQGELVTPTGAALAVQWAAAFAPMPAMTSYTVGYGAGTRDLPDRANVLRVFLGEQTLDTPANDTVAVLETVVDDMNPELLALLTPEMLRAGALDVIVTPVLGKKGRMAQHVTVLARPDSAGPLASLLFTHSTTLGIRVHEEQRWVLKREIRHVNTHWGRVSVKVGLLGNKETASSPEFEDCLACAQMHGVTVRAVYEAALAAALNGEYIHE